ncbi:MAG: TolC family protein, partial [Gammaproteobacteria bacterium]|nr:TolC family protein [Gammaproteobacteria bacterium]
PKLNALTFVAPMYTVHGDALHDVERKYDFASWGPYTHLDMLVSMPLYTFGKLESGVDAADARLAVEKGSLKISENRVKLEVTRMYYTHLYSIAMQKELKRFKTRLSEVQTRAQEFYDAATGKVTKADLMRLRFAETELDKYMLIAKDGTEISLAGLKYLMGRATDFELQLADTKLSNLNMEAPAATDKLVQTAKANRPELQQVEKGLQAATALRKSEASSNKPVIFVAGNLQANWTPTRDHATNPYQYDPYNSLNGGVAVGAKLDLDWALTKSKLDKANAEIAKVKALQQKAVLGIPVEVQKARNKIIRLRDQLRLSKQAGKATRKWVVFTSAEYMTGVGEVKDVLEGLAAMLQSRRDYLETIMQLNVADAELDFVLGL